MRYGESIEAGDPRPPGPEDETMAIRNFKHSTCMERSAWDAGAKAALSTNECPDFDGTPRQVEHYRDGFHFTIGEIEKILARPLPGAAI